MNDYDCHQQQAAHCRGFAPSRRMRESVIPIGRAVFRTSTIVAPSPTGWPLFDSIEPIQLIVRMCRFERTSFIRMGDLGASLRLLASLLSGKVTALSCPLGPHRSPIDEIWCLRELIRLIQFEQTNNQKCSSINRVGHRRATVRRLR